MKLLRCLLIDLEEGLLPLWPLFLGAFGLQLLFGVVLQADAAGLQAESDGPYATPFSLCDHLAYALAGVREYPPEEVQRIAFPTGWLFMLLLAAYACLAYPYRDLTGFGKAVIVAGASRWTWWLAKCLWAIACVAMFWTASVAGAAATTFACSGSLEAGLQECAVVLMRCDTTRLVDASWDMIPFLAGALAMSTSLCLVQLSLSLALRPTLAFMSTIAVLTASVFVSCPFLPAEYLMADRTSCLIANGAYPEAGMICALGLALAAVIGGGFLFSRKDILNKEVSA